MLDRTQQEYIQVMEIWFNMPGLDHAEKALIGNLLAAARRSLADFDAMRHVAVSGFFRETLISAVEKARQQGILQTWPSSD